MKTSVEIRNDLVAIPELDLLGPRPGSTNENEVLPQSPSRWYLMGFLVPYEAPESQRSDATGGEELDVLSKTGGACLFFSPYRRRRRYTTQFILFSGQLGQSSAGTMRLFSQSGGAVALTALLLDRCPRSSRLLRPR